MVRNAAGELWKVAPDLAKEIEEALPATLSRLDIHRLLEDFQRNELHALVSESIEQCGRWRQIQRLLERAVPEAQGTDDRLWSDFSNTSSKSLLPDQAALLLATRHLYRQWRHRLDVLELIAEGQGTHQAEMLYSMRNGRRDHRSR